MAVLRPHHIELLRYIVRQRRPVPTSELDGRNLRPLRARGLIVEHGPTVEPTAEGRRLAQDGERAGQAGRPAASGGAMLSEAQETVLRLLLRAPEPVLADHLDGRVLRALEARGLVRRDGDWLSATEAGREYFDAHVRKERRLRTRRATSGGSGSARAEALLRAIEQLETSVPRGAELQIGEMPAYADDVLAGLRQFARSLGSRTEV